MSETTTSWLDAKQSLSTNIVALTKQTHAAAIEVESDAEKVADMVKLCNALLAKIEAQRKEFTAPINAVVKGINDDAKTLAGPLEAAKVQLGKLLTAWLQRKKAIAEEAARIEREKQEALKLEQAELLEQAGFKEEANEVLDKTVKGTEVAARSVKPTQTRGDYGSTASLRVTWKWEVADLGKVPLPFLVVASPAVTAFMRETSTAIEDEAMERGLRGKERDAWVEAEREKRYAIAGIRFWKEETAGVR